MRISAQMTLAMAAVFTVLCYGVAITGFTSLAGITDPAQAADAKGFAWFWTFLGTVALACALGAWWVVRSTPTDGQD